MEAEEEEEEDDEEEEEEEEEKEEAEESLLFLSPKLSSETPHSSFTCSGIVEVTSLDLEMEDPVLLSRRISTFPPETFLIRVTS